MENRTMSCDADTKCELECLGKNSGDDFDAYAQLNNNNLKKESQESPNNKFSSIKDDASETNNNTRSPSENEFERTVAIRCFRYFIIVLMLSATIAAGVFCWEYLNGEQQRDFLKEVSYYLLDSQEKIKRRNVVSNYCDFCVLKNFVCSFLGYCLPTPAS